MLDQSVSLRISPSKLYTGGSTLEIAKMVDGWRRSVRAIGGYWIGDFSLTASDQISEEFLRSFFYNRLGNHFHERSGGFGTWEGVVYEMELTYPNGQSHRRTFDELFNHVTTTYIDETDTVQTSSAATNDQSIGQYGRREELLLLDGYPQAAAEGQRDTFLKENAWPWSRTVGTGRTVDVMTLEAIVCGYVFTANWRYETAGDGSTDNLSDWISEIIGTDCSTFLRAGKVQSNTKQVVKETNTPQRAWDVMAELLELGDENDLPVRLYVDNDRYVHYETIDTEPRYYLRGGKLYTIAGAKDEVNPWLVKPGVVRDLDYQVSRWDYDGWLQTGRDFYVTEVEVGTGSGLVLKTDLYEETDILASWNEYQYRMQETDKKSVSSTSKGKDRLNWKRKIGLSEADWRKWEKMSPSEKWQFRKNRMDEYRAKKRKRKKK